MVLSGSRAAAVDFAWLYETAEGATSSAHVDTMLVLFCLLYMVLVIASAIVLIRMFRRNPVERELAERANNGEVAP